MADIRIYKRGKVYQYQFEIASQGGKRKYINKSGFKTRAEAHKEGVIAYNNYYNVGKKIQTQDMSYSDFLDYWLDTYSNLNCKYATIMTYNNIIKNHLKPNIGHYRISHIDSKTIQEFINDLYVKHGFSKWYLKNILKVIKGSFKYAYYNLGYIPDNPAERVHIPKYDVVTGDPAHIFTQEEVERILERFKDTHSIYYSFLTAYYTGMRVSECYALTWDCIDFEKKTITIKRII